MSIAQFPKKIKFLVKSGKIEKKLFFFQKPLYIWRKKGYNMKDVSICLFYRGGNNPRLWKNVGETINNNSLKI